MRIPLLSALGTRWYVAAVAAAAVVVASGGYAGYAPPAAADAAQKDPAARHASAEARAAVQAHATGKRVEVKPDRTATSTTFAKPKGGFVTEASAGPSRVRQKDGSWAAVDQSLQATSTSSAARLAPAASPAKVTLSGGGSGNIATLDLSPKTSVGVRWPSTLPDPTVEGPTATYAVADAARLQATAQTSGFSARVLLDKPPASAPVYRFDLDLHGLKASLSHGMLQLSDGSGKVVAVSRPLSMWDARVDDGGDPAHQVPVDASLQDTAGGGQQLVLKPSMDYLTDPATVYPVTIDPDVSSVDRQGDTYVFTGNSTPQYQDYRLRVGDDDAQSRVYRSHLKFHTEAFTGRTITQASLDLFQYEAVSCQDKVTMVYPETSMVANGQMVWGNQPSVSKSSAWAESPSFNTGGKGCPDPNGHVQLDVTKTVSAWTSGELTRFGMQLRAADEAAPSQAKRFCSMNPDATLTYCGSVDREPTLSLSWTPQLGMQPWYSMTSHRLNDRSQLRVNNESGDAVIQAQDLRIKGVGHDLAFDRFYNGLTTTAGAFGVGWTASVGPDVKLKRLTDDRYDYVAPSGTVFGTFVRKPSDPSHFHTPQAGGVDADLVDNNDGTMTLTFDKSQEKYTFDNLGCGSCDLVMATDTDKHGNAITYHYNTSQQLTQVTDTAGRDVTVDYNSAGFISKLTDANVSPTRTWSYGYTGDHLTSYTDPTGAVTGYDWTGDRVTAITDPAQNGNVVPYTTIDYESGQATQVRYERDGAGGVYEFDWAYANTPSERCNGKGQASTDVTDYSDDPGGVTTYCFADRSDTQNRAVHVVDGGGNTRSTSYTADQAASSMTDPANQGVTDGATVFSYNPNQALTQVTEPTDTAGDTPATTYFDYANPGSVAGGSFLPTSKTSPQGACTAYGYNNDGGVTDSWQGITPASGHHCSDQKADATQHSHVDYNDNGTPKDAYTDSGDGSNPADQTVYSYYGSGPNKGQLKQVVRPGGDLACTASSRRLCTSYSYDGASRVTSVTDGRGKTTRYGYDANDRITQVLTDNATSCDHDAGTCTSYDYDGEGNLVSRTDKRGVWRYGYDQLNQLESYTYPGGDQIRTTYNGAGNLTKYTQHVEASNATDTVTYTYNAANQPTSVTDATGQTTISPDADGRRGQVTFPPGTGVAESFDYTKSGKISGITITGGTGIAAISYSYTDGGTETDKLQKTTRGGTTLTYAYDTVDRLKHVAANPGKNYTFDYDGDGNLVTRTAGSDTTHFGYNEADELCWTGPNTGTAMARHCPATPSGNTTWASDGAGNNTGTSDGPLTYNAANQATGLTDPDGGTTVDQHYTDQGNDLRTAAGNTSFLVGPLDVTARTTGGQTTFYTRDPAGNLIDQHGHGGTRYYTTDRLNSVTGMIDSSGGTAATYDYSPYGKTADTTGSPGNNPWQYAGGYHDTQGDGYYHYGARYYNPSIGRFTQPDSVQGSLTRADTYNPYLYASCDPTNNTDLSGRVPLATKCAELGLLGAGVGALVGATGGPPGVILGAAGGIIVGAGACIIANQEKL
ncbi:MAG: RHS repeat-associated core domain-containing protein [Streptosporangiales bacterium]